MRPGKIALVVVGALAVVTGLGLALGGGVALWASATQRDATGYFVTSTETFRTSGYALASTTDFGTQPGPRDWASIDHLGTVRIRAELTGGGAVFIGIGPKAQVDAYLSGVAHDEVVNVTFLPFRADYRHVFGVAAPALPSGEAFWVARATGNGTQSLSWPTEPGRWAAVVMRADARSDVVADVSVGINVGWLVPLGFGLGAAGLVLLAGGGLMLAFGLAGLGTPAGAAGVPTELTEPAGAAGVPGAYPVRLDGHLDPVLSRWKWLVKWLLALPHAIVLAVLWVAVLALTVVAGLSILFTGRYPRSIFEFNLGVMRWTWRVSFYAFGALGTDRYPPFSLQPDASYPADFSVDYPERLSRGLVLVKWWLLALPQYLIVTVFAGGWVGLSGRSGDTWRVLGGGGLIGLLVVIAAVGLAVSGRFPEGLFDFILGLNRWCYRVLAYGALMRDEYPPFRLDPGGTDPGSRSAAPSRDPERAGDIAGSSG